MLFRQLRYRPIPRQSIKNQHYPNTFQTQRADKSYPALRRIFSCGLQKWQGKSPADFKSDPKTEIVTFAEEPGRPGPSHCFKPRGFLKPLGPNFPRGLIAGT